MSDRTTGAFGSFDAQRPPAASELADCVHCGFCLPSCPTYGLWAEEMDSPRGRIDLVKGVLEGSLDMSTSFVAHMDACLGCMACVQACPSGVRYDHILQAARAQIERRVRRPLADRAFRAAVFMVFPHPHRMRAAAVGAWAYRRSGLAGALRRHGATERLPPRLAAIEALAPDVRITDLFRRLPVATRAQGRRRRRVGLLSGCVAQVYFSDVHAATIRALAAEGCEVLVPRGQGCCGALAVHAGREAQAMAAARATVDAWEGTGIDTLVTNAAGCGSSLKEHGALLADDPAYAARAAALSAKVMDVTELLASLPRQAPRHELALRVAYHDACHL
ncbi:MAG: (Fe-S)-binding protein, partial [Acidimicrobiales bacterium]